MKKKITTLAIALVISVASNCFSQEKAIKGFKLPTVPDSLQSVESRFNYVVDNYWNNFDFSDTDNINSRDTEEALVNYIDLISRIPLKNGQEQLKKLFRKISANIPMQEYINTLARKYLVNYDSPMRNDLLYIGVAEYLAENAIDEIIKYNAKQDIIILSKNLPGTKATDFHFTVPTGETKNMESIESPYIIVLFYNPDCKACSHILKETNSSEIINKSLEEGKAKLLAIYPQDDSSIWRNYIKNTPDKWINGCDNGMKLISEVKYDLRVLPVLYLLDSNKKVIMKDVPLSKIEEFFQ